MAEYFTNEASVSGDTVKGITYDLGVAGSRVLLQDVTLNASTTTRSFSASELGTVSVTVDTAYLGATMVVILADRSSYTTTVPVASAGTASLTDNGYGAIGPEEARMRLLGYI